MPRRAGKVFFLLLFLFIGVASWYNNFACRNRIMRKKLLLASSWQENDVVMFEDGSTRLPQLGVILKGQSSLHPLALRGEQEEAETEQDVLFGLVDVDDEDASIQLSNVRILGVLEEVLLSQRAVEDRVHNPHGEHAEDVFIIRRDTLPRHILARYRLGKQQEQEKADDGA